MTIAEFREQYGQAFYGFINSELGRAMLAVLKGNDPADRVVTLAPNEQTANSTLFLGQVTGWRDCILTLQNQLIVGEGAPAEIESTYEGEELETFIPSPKVPVPAPPPPPTLAHESGPKRKKNTKRK